jgi:hypothetical protein
MWVIWEEKLFCLQQWFVSGSQLSFFPASKLSYDDIILILNRINTSKNNSLKLEEN